LSYPNPHFVQYMHKGSDKSAFKVSVAGKSTAPVDEIANFKSARYIGPHEACYHLFEFKMYSSSHSFERLSVHFVGNQSVVYNVEGEPVDVAPEVHHDDDEDDEEDEEDDSGSVDLNSGDEQSKKKGKYEPTGASKLLAYYAAVSAEVPDQKYKFGPRATDLRFIDFPQYYSYSNKEGWLRRSKRTYDRVCVRVHMVSMVNPELYYLRLLLLNVPGVKSEESLKDIHYNGVRSPTFHAACMAHGLAHDDKEWHLSMHEASKVQGKMGRVLRILYSTIFAPLKVMKCADPSSSSPMECTSSVLKRNRPQSDVESGIVKVKREDGREEMLYPSSVSNSKPIISSSSLKRTRSGAESEEYVLSSGEEDMRGLRKRHLKFPDGTSADPEAIELSGDEEGPPQNEFVPPFATLIFDECQVMQDNILHRTRTTALSADASGVRDLMQNRTRDQNVMVMVKFGTEIDTIKMLCLMEFEQLNDEVINVYFRMIELRSRLSESRHKVSVLNTFLMNSLLQNQNGFDYNRVRNYGKKLNGNRMGMVWGYDGTAATEQSRIDLLLIPVHLGNHWILLSVAFKSRTIYCFDSLGDCQSSKLFYALAYLEHEFQKYGLPFYTEQWTQVNSRGQGPQQQNFLDCGVFMTMMADYISLDLEPNYRCVCPGTAEDHRKLPKEFCTCGSRAAIQCFRDHMVLSIAHGKIL